MFLIIKGKDQTRDVLHYGTKEEGDRDGQEYRQNNGKCLIRIQQVPQLQSSVGMGYFNQSKCNSTS